VLRYAGCRQIGLRTKARKDPIMSVALIVEDDKNSLDGYAELIRGEGFETLTAQTVGDARRLVREHTVDVAILDLQLPDGTGIDLLEELGENPHTEVVMITGHGSIDSAVEALRRGASDYLTKPVEIHRLRKILDKARATKELRDQVGRLRGELRRLGRFGCLTGGSASMQQVYDLISRVAPTGSTVLISGETGVGKELVARMVHELSQRSKKPFVAVNCGAVPGSLIESELFGHEKGSFTGAERRRAGILRQADGGTLFLDEITEMPTELQVKLLRVLETRSFTAVGSDRTLQVDLRVIAATNRDPERAVEEGRLRRDLFYRLNVFPIEVPALRQRPDDIEVLANHFLAELNRSANTVKRLSDAATARLRKHTWPGNVRQLKNVIERAYILAGDVIESGDVPLKDGAPPDEGETLRVPIGSSLEDAERRLILATLDHTRGQKRRAASLLGISVKTLYNRLKAYGLQADGEPARRVDDRPDPDSAT
jgi:DNA-binding NtrC family response regulator